MAEGQVPKIVAVPVTNAGYEYLQEAWKGLVGGGPGAQTLLPGVQEVLSALHRLASGGRLDSPVNVVGGNPSHLDKLLRDSITEANEVNRRLGQIRIFS